MKNHLNDILEDLYMLDPSLKKQEKDLKKLIEKLVAAKPNLKIDNNFVGGLRRQLSAKADEMMEISGRARGSFIQSLHRFIFPFAGGVLATVLVVVVVLGFNNKFQSFSLPTKEIKEAPRISVEDFDVIPPLERLPRADELKVGMGGGIEPLREPGDPKPEDIKVYNDSFEMEEPVMMMMAMPSAVSEVERVAADDLLIVVEEWLLENGEGLLEEQRQLLDEKVKVLADLLANENADLAAIQTATEELNNFLLDF